LKTLAGFVGLFRQELKENIEKKTLRWFEMKFKGLKERTVELKGDWVPKENCPDGIVKVQPRVEDAELFLTMKQTMDEETAKVPTKVLTAMFKRANPEDDEEDIKTFIAMNYGELMTKIAPLFGFKTDLAANLQKQIKKKVI